MKIKKLNESSLVDKKISTLGKTGKPMYFTDDQLKDAKAKYPEYHFEETTIDKSLPQGQKAYIAKKKVNEAIEPQNTMKIMPLSGLNADGFTVIVFDSEGKEIFNKEYRYGVNASYDRKFAQWAEKDYNDSIKYGWKTPRVLKPYVADIIDELCKEYAVDKSSIDFVAGKNMFSGGDVTDDFVTRMKQRVYESKSTTSRGRELAEDINDPDEVLEFKRNVEAAENAEEIEDLIISLSDGVAEDAVQRAFNENEDADDLQTVKDAVIREIDIYLEDNEWLGESKSMNENSSLYQKNKDGSIYKMTPDVTKVLQEIARLYKFFDYKKDVAKVKFRSDVIRQLHIFCQWYVEEANNTKPDTRELKNLAIQISNIVRTRNVIAESKTVKALGAKGKKLEEDTKPSEEQIARVNELVDDFKAYNGDPNDTESFGEWLKQFGGFTNKGTNDILRVWKYIKEREHLDEDATQYGVHQFSTDSIVFRGTEQECGEYIDNNQKLWDDAEVYRIEPGDPHYKNMTEAARFDSNKYVGMEAAFDSRNDDWSDAEEIIEYDGQSSKITGCAVDNDSFRDSYWDIVFEDGKEFGAISGYNLALQKSMKEASYGGAYDIEDDQYFTRDDLNSFAEEVLGHISETFEGKYDIGGVWFENGNVTTQIVDPEGNEFQDTTHVDMRRIREPWHLKRMYAFPVATTLISQIKSFLKDSGAITENAQGEGKYSDVFHRYLEWLLDEGYEDNIGYLASQLIRYCPEEDLKDLWYDRMEKVARTVGYTDAEDQPVVTEALQDEAQVSQRYVDVEIPDLCKKVLDYIPNMSEGALIALNRHCLRWHSSVEDVLDGSGYYKNESLTEDVDVPTLTGPEEGPKSGVAALINEAIQEELKTVQMYNDIAVTARAEGFEEIAGQIDEINTEENKHIGQLQEVLKTVAPNAQAIDAGELEAGDEVVTVEENTNNSTENPNTNIKEDVSMGKERWQEIYNSFKAVEDELNQDGEAVTAVVDQMYRDNQSDPDYKKAYDKWASGE